MKTTRNNAMDSSKSFSLYFPLFLKSPRRAAEACRNESALGPNMKIYIAFVACSTIFYWLKPWDFPDQLSAEPAASHDLLFWLKVMLWQPPLEAAWIAFLIGFIAWFKNGSWPLRFSCAVLWTGAVFWLTIAYGQGAIGKSAYAAASLACLSPFAFLLRKLNAAEAKSLAAFLLGLNAIGIVLLLPMEGAVGLDWPNLFKAAQILGGLWILAAGTTGVKTLSGLRLPRAFMAVLLSLFFQMSLAITLYLSGAVPKEILKALLYA
ncbi:MAG: hypothetical protein HY921_01630 [Elusimicrobia bacterium]|nr:hypothetical protein [Elusimicrobiota bacterium]